MMRLAVVLGAAVLAAAVASPLLYLYFDGGSSGDTPAPATAPSTVHLVARDQVQDELHRFCVGLTSGGNPYVGTRQRAKLVRLLEDPPTKSHNLYVNAAIAVARDQLRFGEVQAATSLLAEALDDERRDDPTGKHMNELLEALALAYLKMGELDNCLSPGGSLICTLPLDRTQVHQNTQGSTNAIQHFLELLELDPDNIKARWLLNVAHMTLGTYPDEVPQEHRISLGAAAAAAGIERFPNVAAAVGLYKVNLAGGSIIEDFDNDGLFDIMTSTWDPCGPITYYHNDGNGVFSDRTARAGLDGLVGGLNIVQSDYNNDGWMDALVMRGGWMIDDGQMRVSLLRNNGDGTFSDVTHEAGLAFPANPSQSASWADYDGDGDLDLYSCNESIPDTAPGGQGDIKFASQLFRNEGDGTFVEVTRDAGVRNLLYCKGSVWGDYDNDGDPDLYVSNFAGPNRLYRNNGDGTFTDVAPDLQVTEPINSFPTWFWDYDNDGWLDLFVAGYGTDIGDVAADYLGHSNGGARMRLYRNDGSGGFVDVTEESGLYKVHLSMGANFGDLDNDGFLDFYLGTGAPGYDAVGPNVMYRNNAGRDFTDVSFAGGFGHLQKGHGVAFGDLDRDGDQDIFLQVGGFFPGDGFSNALYHNPGQGNHWLSLKLVGRESNRAAIGARIRLTVVSGSGVRDIHALVTSGGSFGASSLEQEIGLGDATGIESLGVYWPTSGIRQRFSDVPLDSHIRLEEGDDEFTVLEFPRIEFKP